MQDYKEIYLKLMRATEDAIRILIDAQRSCEEIYLSSDKGTVVPHPVQSHNAEK